MKKSGAVNPFLYSNKSSSFFKLPFLVEKDIFLFVSGYSEQQSGWPVVIFDSDQNNVNPWTCNFVITHQNMEMFERNRSNIKTVKKAQNDKEITIVMRTYSKDHRMVEFTVKPNTRKPFTVRLNKALFCR